MNPGVLFMVLGLLAAVGIPLAGSYAEGLWKLPRVSFRKRHPWGHRAYEVDDPEGYAGTQTAARGAAPLCWARWGREWLLVGRRDGRTVIT